MTYAAYLRVCEPVSACPESDRSRRAGYAVSSTRPRRRDSLTAEHAEALRRAIAAHMVAPERESERAYVRRADGITSVCPWQTRLRCLLAYLRRTWPGSISEVRVDPVEHGRTVFRSLGVMRR